MSLSFLLVIQALLKTSSVVFHGNFQTFEDRKSEKIMVTTIKAEIKIIVASGKREKLRVRQLVAAASLFLIDSQDKAPCCDW